MADAAIEIDSVEKRYGAHPALRGVSLSVGAGEKIVICGPSGSGKSTLIRCINGLEAHDAGRVSVFGTVLDRSPRALEAVRRRVGMVFQQFNLFPHLTALENCVLPQIRALGRPRAAAEREAEAQLARMRVGPHRGKFPNQLSGGQQQRVAIARALCMEPEAMLFDEPTSALDPEMVAEVLDVMRELAEGHMTILCVTHELGFARQVADRVIFMADGRIVEQGPPDRIFDAPQQQATIQFVGALLT